MDAKTFDRLTRRLSQGNTRRTFLRGVAAIGAAGALVASRSTPAAADCTDGFMRCMLPHWLGGYTDQGSAGVYGRCWNWTKLICEPCPSSVEAATRHCNEFYAQACAGKCVAW